MGKIGIYKWSGHFWYTHFRVPGRAPPSPAPILPLPVPQNELRRVALADLVLSARVASKCPREHRQGTLANCIAQFSATCVPFVADPATRAVLYPQLLAILEQVPGRLDVTQDRELSDMLLYLYLALFECLKDRQEHQSGIDKMKQALRQLPRTHHKALWEADIEFRCRLGLNPTQTLNRVKEYDTETQARAWLTLAR